MKELLKETLEYRVDNEEEAIALIQEFKDKQIDEGYTLDKSGYVLKTKKNKGEIVDSYAIATVRKNFEY